MSCTLKKVATYKAKSIYTMFDYRFCVHKDGNMYMYCSNHEIAVLGPDGSVTKHELFGSPFGQDYGIYPAPIIMEHYLVHPRVSDNFHPRASDNFHLVVTDLNLNVLWTKETKGWRLYVKPLNANRFVYASVAGANELNAFCVDVLGKECWHYVNADDHLEENVKVFIEQIIPLPDGRVVLHVRYAELDNDNDNMNDEYIILDEDGKVRKRIMPELPKELKSSFRPAALSELIVGDDDLICIVNRYQVKKWTEATPNVGEVIILDNEYNVVYQNISNKWLDLHMTLHRNYLIYRLSAHDVFTGNAIYAFDYVTGESKELGKELMSSPRKAKSYGENLLMVTSVWDKLPVWGKNNKTASVITYFDGNYERIFEHKAPGDVITAEIKNGYLYYNTTKQVCVYKIEGAAIFS